LCPLSADILCDQGPQRAPQKMADMVGLVVSGIVLEVSVHDNQKVANGDVVFNRAPTHFLLVSVSKPI
jgi:hypothetical protein